MVYGSSIKLDASGSAIHTLGETITAYAWDINGDKTYGELTGSKPTLVWSSFPLTVGNHTIAVKITTSLGQVAVASTALGVYHAPVASSGGPYSVLMGNSITLNGSGSTTLDSGDSITAYDWDINGDGIYGDVTGAQPSLPWSTYSLSVGSHTIGLRVTSSHGLTATSFSTLSVTSLPPVAIIALNGNIFAYHSDIILVGNTSIATNPIDSITEYSWDINGDGVYGDITGATPLITWAAFHLTAGTHLISLRVTNAYGQQSTDSEIITIIEYPPVINIIYPNAVINYGQTVIFDATRSYDSSGDNDPLSFAWDINNDGVYGDKTGAIMYLGPAEYVYAINQSRSIGLRVKNNITALQSFATVTYFMSDPPTYITTKPSSFTLEATGPTGAVGFFNASATYMANTAWPVVASPASGSLFPIGATTVQLTSTNASAYSTTASFTVTVKDTTPPFITTPAPVTVEATGPSGAAVGFAATAADLVSGSRAVSATPASGSVFPVGVTTVNLSAADPSGNVATSSFTVTVKDTTPPFITTPAPVTVEATGPSGAAVGFAATAADLVSGTRAVSATPASGSIFPVGVTTVNLSASDPSGNVATSSFTVTVKDTTPPVITTPAPVAVEATGPSGAAVGFAATAADLVSGSRAVSATPASGSIFPLGVTSVNLSSTDSAGNTATSSFPVAVLDTTPPVITKPGNLVLSATSYAGAVALFTASAVDAVDGVRSVAFSPASGSIFPAGNTNVTASSTDTHGNSSSVTFRITVVLTPYQVWKQAAGLPFNLADYIAAFNHLTPFPGTPLYQRLKTEGRLLYESWWLDERYSYNRIPFQPRGMSPEALQRDCLAARRKFYSWPSIMRRGFDEVNRSDAFMWRNFYLINAMHRNDVSQRDHYPLGDESWQGPLLMAN